MRLDQFERFHPIVPFFYYAGSLLLLLIMLHPLFLFSGAVVILILNFLHDRFTGLRQWTFFMITSGLFIIVLNPIFNERGRTALFEVSQHRVTLEAVIYGSMSALSLVCVIALFVSYNLIMTPHKILFLFSKFLPQFAVLLMLTLRFIPLMKRRLDEISIIQNSKGISVRRGSLKERAKKGMLHVQVLLTYSLEEAVQTADSMKARGYGQKKRTTYEFYRFNRRDAISIAYLTAFFVIIIYGRFMGYGHFTIYPIMEPYQPPFIEMMYLVAFIMLLIFPVLVEIGERARWRLFN